MNSFKGYWRKHLWVVTACIGLSCAGYASAQQLSNGMTAQGIAPPELEWISAKREKDLIEKGYIEDLLRPSRAEYVYERIQEKRAAATLKGKPGDSNELGFYSGPDFDKGIPYLPFSPAIVPARFLDPSSERYLIPGGQRVKQFYTKSVFGRLITDELLVDEVNLNAPNLSVSGAPAKLITIKHENASWATVLYAQSKGRLFIIEAERKLEGKQKQDYIEFAETLIAGAE